MEASIRLHEVRKVFPAGARFVKELITGRASSAQAGDNVAVAGVSLSISQGECLGIVGRNGAGKSTLLHMIAGLSSATSGKLEIDGKVTAVMTLGVGLREDLSGRENIYVDGEIQGKSRREIDGFINQITDFADLGEFIDFPVRTYSTGMKARLGFSMISHIDPEILVIDEALSAGDAGFARKATRRIREICDRGKIVIIVSHGMQAIREMCNRCLWMDKAQIVMDGEPEEVTRAYIESVRTDDEALLKEKFQKFIGTHTTKPGWCINHVSWFNGQSTEPRAMLESEAPTRLLVEGESPTGDTGSRIRISIARLDELLVFDETFDTDSFTTGKQDIALEVRMEYLALAPAIYRMRITVEGNNEIYAEHTSIFEVFANNPPAGGKPVLLYPVTSHSRLLESASGAE